MRSIEKSIYLNTIKYCRRQHKNFIKRKNTFYRYCIRIFDGNILPINTI